MPRRLPDAMSWHVSGASDPARRAAASSRPSANERPASTTRPPARPAPAGRPAASSRPSDARRALIARRRRVLLVLLALVVVSFVAVVAGALPLIVQLLVDLVFVGYLWHLRVEARNAARLRAGQASARRAPAPVPSRPPAAPRVPAPAPAPVVTEVPTVEVPVGAPAAVHEVPVEAHDDPAASTGTDGWQPVPVPPPTYTLKPPAPPVIDLTRPGAWSDGLLDEDPVLDPGEWDDDDLDAIVERRRAVGD